MKPTSTPINSTKTPKGKTMKSQSNTSQNKRMTKKEKDLQRQIQQQSYSSLVDEYAERLKSFLEKDEKLKNNSSDIRKERVIFYIEIGKDLKAAKAELSTNDFIRLVSEIAVSQRSIDRYIEFVSDKRISEITIQNLRLLQKPSKAKLLKMRDLNNADFQKVLDGDDKPYQTLLKKMDEEKYDSMVSPFKNISNKMYQDFKKEGLDYALKIMDGKITTAKISEKKYKSELADIKLNSVNKVYTGKQKVVA